MGILIPSKARGVQPYIALTVNPFDNPSILTSLGIFKILVLNIIVLMCALSASSKAREAYSPTASLPWSMVSNSQLFLIPEAYFNSKSCVSIQDFRVIAECAQSHLQRLPGLDSQWHYCPNCISPSYHFLNRHSQTSFEIPG